jgi:hypothetical protein
MRSTKETEWGRQETLGNGSGPEIRSGPGSLLTILCAGVHPHRPWDTHNLLGGRRLIRRASSSAARCVIRPWRSRALITAFIVVLISRFGWSIGLIVQTIKTVCTLSATLAATSNAVAGATRHLFVGKRRAGVSTDGPTVSLGSIFFFVKLLDLRLACDGTSVHGGFSLVGIAFISAALVAVVFLWVGDVASWLC